MTETKEVGPYKNVTYTIKRWSFDEGTIVDAYIDQNPNIKLQQRFIVLNGVVNPAFTDETIGKTDYEVVARLWFDIRNFNQFDTDFLEQLRSLSSPVGRTPVEASPQ